MKGTMEGKCKYCGQIIWVNAQNSEEADKRAGESCDCGGYKLERRLIDAKNVIKSFAEKLRQSKTKKLCRRR